MRLYNTLTKKIEEFKPMDPGRVKMYTCGPTVYDYMHIGNLRTFVFSDILQRVLKFNNYKVESVQNITDIDDKIIKRAKERNTTIDKISEKYTKYFLIDTEKLNIQEPQFQPKATEYIEKMIRYIEVLIEKGFAYVEKDGSVYFDISKFPDYGILSGVSNRELKTGTRVLSDEYTKENVQDFALWKSVPLEDKVDYPSPWGRGRPGWHIECSVMSQDILGNKLDIHAGGIDLIFPHHENEIAQSEAETGEKPFVKYWAHGAHMLVDDKKMSKSLGNFYTLSDLEKRGIEPLALRYLYLQTHYRQEMNFTWEALGGAQKALNRLREEISKWGEEELLSSMSEAENNRERGFLEAVNEDLNMPKAMAVVWDLVRSKEEPETKVRLLFRFDQVLGLKLKDVSSIKYQVLSIPEEVQQLVKEREQLRKEKKFHLADQIRNRVKKMGYEIEDKDNEEVEIRKI
ncbi:MAG: cysteine--tRNA ligase [bacterium]|nr:cysteine--tRNA ligase [bacterium]